jgi:hypothetical protein
LVFCPADTLGSVQRIDLPHRTDAEVAEEKGARAVA